MIVINSIIEFESYFNTMADNLNGGMSFFFGRDTHVFNSLQNNHPNGIYYVEQPSVRWEGQGRNTRKYFATKILIAKHHSSEEKNSMIEALSLCADLAEQVLYQLFDNDRLISDYKSFRAEPADGYFGENISAYIISFDLLSRQMVCFDQNLWN